MSKINWATVRSSESLVLLLFFLVNVGLKSIYLTTESLWLDEVSNLNWVIHSFQYITEKSLTDPNGPVYQYIYKVWIEVFGISEFSIRMLPNIIASMIVWPLFYTGRELFDRKTAYLTLVLFTLSTVFISYAQEARSYTLVALLSMYSFYYFIRVIKRGRFSDAVWYTLFNIILFFTHLTAVLILSAQFFATLLYIRTAFRRIALLYGGMFISVVLLAVWLLNNSFFGGNESTWYAVPELGDITKMLSIYLNKKQVLHILYIALAIYLLRLVLDKQRAELKNKELMLVLFWGVLPILVMFVASVYYNPRFIPRYMLIAVPGLLLSLSYLVLHCFKVKWINYLLAAYLIFLMIQNINLKPTKAEKWREAISLLHKYEDENTLKTLCIFYQYMSFAYYYDIEAFEDYDNTIKRLEQSKVKITCDLEGLKGFVAKNPDATKLVMVLSHDFVADPEEKNLSYMYDHYKLIDSRTDLSGIRVFVFDLTSAPAGPVQIEIDPVDVERETYTILLKKPISELIDRRISKLDFKCIIETQEEIPEALLVFSIMDKSGKNTSWKGIKLDFVVPGQPNEIAQVINYPNKVLMDKLEIQLWQPKSKKELSIKDIQLALQ